MIKLFAKYASIGVVNTLIHWVVFIILYTYGQTQSMSNLVAFSFAVTFSFFANAKWTFNAEASTIRYLLYLFFMGMMATAMGMCADHYHTNPMVTLVVFSGISLVCGFVYSKYIVFRSKK